MAITYTDLLAKLGIGGAHPGSLTITKKIMSRLSLNSQTRILDVGCGTGQTVAYIAEQSPSIVVGLDKNEIMVAKAQNRIHSKSIEARVVQGSTESLPFKSNSFDIILSESVISFTNIPKSLKEFGRVLRPNGILILNEMTNDGSLSEEEQETIKAFYGVTSVLTQKEWIQKADNAGFHLDDAEEIDPFNNEEVECDYSDDINQDTYDMMAQHYILNERFSQRLKPLIYYCQLKGNDDDRN